MIVIGVPVSGETPNALVLRNVLALWAFPLATLYVLGLAAAWVVRGFHQARRHS